MAKMTLTTFYWALSICLNFILLTTVVRQAYYRPIALEDTASRLTAAASVDGAQSAIRSTDESLHAMYGEPGNFSDHDEHLLNYIRSMTSRPGPGGRRLQQPWRLHFSQVGRVIFVMIDFFAVVFIIVLKYFFVIVIVIVNVDRTGIVKSKEYQGHYLMV